MNLFSNNWLKGEMKIRCLLGHTDMDIGRKCQVKQGVYSITVDAFFEVFVLSPVLVLVVFLVLVQYFECKNDQIDGLHIFYTIYLIIKISYILTHNNLFYCPQDFGCYGNNFWRHFLSNG